MSVLSKLAGKTGKIFAPVTKVTGKVMSKFDANKPELMVASGVIMVLVGTVWMIVNTRKADNIIEESHDQMTEIEMDKDAGELTEAEFKKAVMKARSETVWKFVKLYGLPGLIFVLGLFDMIGGHFVLKKRYLLATTSLEGMRKFIAFVKQNVIDDAGEEKWEQYSKGVVGTKKMEMETTTPDGIVIKKTAEAKVCKDHENPWRIEFSEELFKSWKPDMDTNFFFLKGVQDYFNEVKYQRNKDAEISIYEVLDYLRIDWSKIDKNYRTWLRNQVWGHHIYGDDVISFGLNIPMNDPARRRVGDKIFMEFNTDGEPKDIINRYHDPAYLMNKPKSSLLIA